MNKTTSVHQMPWDPVFKFLKLLYLHKYTNVKSDTLKIKLSVQYSVYKQLVKILTYLSINISPELKCISGA